MGDQAEAYLRTHSGTILPSFPFPYAVDSQWAAFLNDRGWPAEAFMMLGIMKWNKREHPLTLIEAFRQPAERNVHLRLIFVGDCPVRLLVEQRLPGLKDHVNCPGYAPFSSLLRWYGLADVFMHRALDEPWGVSVNESLASGLPVLASADVGTEVDLMRPEGCGVELPAGDVPALAAAIERLLEEPGLRRCCVQAAREVAEAHDSTHTIKQVEAALACVCHG